MEKAKIENRTTKEVVQEETSISVNDAKVEINLSKITVENSATVKIGDSYYKFTLGNEYEINNANENDFEKIALSLTDKINSVIDMQIDELIKALK